MRKISDEPKNDDDRDDLKQIVLNQRKDHRKLTIDTLRNEFKLGRVVAQKPEFCINIIPLDSNKSHDEGFSPIRSSEKTVFSSLYYQEETLGQGATAVVKKVRRSTDDHCFAAKIVRPRDLEYLNLMRKEYQIMSVLDHSKIVKAHEFLYNETKSKTYLILEYIRGKTFKELIEERGKIPEFEMRKYISQLVDVLDYIHSKGICHRDLTASNIIINENQDLKVIDFSVCAIFNDDLWNNDGSLNLQRTRTHDDIYLPGKMLTNTGTNEYKAPEIILSAPYDQRIDMWALGVLTYYGLCGKLPFKAKYLEKLYKKIKDAKVKFKPEDFKGITEEAKLFIKACLTKTSFVRLSPKEAKVHPWIKGLTLIDESSPLGTNNPELFRISSPQPKSHSKTSCEDSSPDTYTPQLKKKSTYFWMDDTNTQRPK